MPLLHRVDSTCTKFWFPLMRLIVNIDYLFSFRLVFSESATIMKLILLFFLFRFSICQSMVLFESIEQSFQEKSRIHCISIFLSKYSKTDYLRLNLQNIQTPWYLLPIMKPDRHKLIQVKFSWKCSLTDLKVYYDLLYILNRTPELQAICVWNT